MEASKVAVKAEVEMAAVREAVVKAVGSAAEAREVGKAEVVRAAETVEAATEAVRRWRRRRWRRRLWWHNRRHARCGVDGRDAERGTGGDLEAAAPPGIGKT